MFQNKEREQAILGSIIIEEKLLFNLDIEKEDFYNINNETIFSTIVEMNKQTKKIDFITLKAELENKKELQKIGGIQYLIKLTSNIETVSNLKEYVKILKNCSNKRKIKNIIENANKELLNGSEGEEIITNLQKNLNGIETKKEDKTMNDYYIETLDLIEELKYKKDDLIGYSFGKEFKRLDKATGGIIPGKVYRIAGASNVGKSWLLYNFILSILEQNGSVMFYSLENEQIFTIKNLLGLKKQINTMPYCLRVNTNLDFNSEAEWYSKKNFKIDKKNKTITSFFREAVKNKTDVICIDYLQLHKGEEKFNSKEEKYSTYSANIKELAEKYNIAVIDLSQLSNDVKRGGASGEGSDEFKGSGSLKDDTDVGIHIFKSNEDEDENKDGYVFNRILKLTKNRLGPGVGNKINYIMDFNKGGIWIQDIKWHNLKKYGIE